MREDRSVLDLLNADYTFVNERLARHYGIPNVYGSHFRRVTLQGDARRGLLGQGSILTRDVGRQPHVARRPRQVDSREHARHAAAAAAAERAGAQGKRRPRRVTPTLRCAQRMEEHRANPVCATLPQDHGSDRLRARELRPTGKWRTTDGAHADRCRPASCGRHEARWTGESSRRAADISRAIRQNRHRKIDDLRRGSRDAVLRHAGRACHLAAGCRRIFDFLRSWSGSLRVRRFKCE